MPILPAEPDQFPVDLWEDGHLDPDPQRRWWCLHTKPRQEKATARHLLAQCLPFYLPLVVQEGRTPGGRKTRSIVPLFPGYLFLHGDDRARVEALKGNTLAGVLAVGDSTALT